MVSSDSHFAVSQGRRTEFPATHWTVVLAASDSGGPGMHEALDELCGAYWPPVYAFVCRQGHSPDDALDLAQGFFARFLERKQVKLADPDRGRFRSFLLSSLKNFLANDWTRGQAEKRGGGPFIAVVGPTE